MTSLPVTFDEHGLIPAVVQDADSGEVLMMAYMNAEALERTRETGKTHFWSRSRGKLWRKGETSGHIQLVKSIAVNCYENCLLIRVQQVGACCHTGYPTCFYRELDASGNLVTVSAKAFDPADVYSRPRDLETTLVTWVGAYRWLADHDLRTESRTSRHLHVSEVRDVSGRVADELAELAGVLRGKHSHSTLEADIILEGSQALYWSVVTAIRAGLTDSEIVAALTIDADVAGADVANLLIAEASSWNGIPAAGVAERLSAVAPLIAAAAATVRVDLSTLLEHDLAELRQRPYLDEYFRARTGIIAADS